MHGSGFMFSKGDVVEVSETNEPFFALHLLRHPFSLPLSVK